jgi:xanthine dehydrogenase accessory factor
MYGIAMTVAACLQAGTRADVAWLIEADGLEVTDWSDAVVFTPGGGRIGSLLGGAIDGTLGDLTGRWAVGRVVEVEVSATDALIAGLPRPGRARCVLAPAEVLPSSTWKLAAKRERFALEVGLDGDEVTAVEVYPESAIADADELVRRAFTDRGSGSVIADDGLVSVFSAVTQMVVVGSGPVAESVARLASLLGWQARVSTDQATVGGLMAQLSSRDMVVVAAHDLELAGAALSAALGSECGYIGSVGSREMQANRADWLAYRGITDLDRVHGPAGLDIGAASPGEIAVSIVAEAIAARR